jgi:hypothetical protein
MLKWTTAIVALLMCSIGTFALFQRRALRHASLIDAMNTLEVAYADYSVRGYLTNFPPYNWWIWRSTNIVTIDGTPYQCWAKVGGGFGDGFRMLAMTTNQVFIWMDPEQPPKIITTADTPGLFSGGY